MAITEPADNAPPYTYTTPIREGIRRANELTDDADTATPKRIPATALGTGAVTGSKFLRDDRTWQLPPGSSSGLTTKNWEDRCKAVWAIAPSSESGLTALSVNASTDDRARIQAMLNYLNTTYGRGSTLILSSGTSNVNSAVTLPAGVRIQGVPGESLWDFWGAGTGTFTAITISDNDCTPITGLRINGQQWDSNTSTANVTTNTGLNIAGHHLNFVDVKVSGFNRGINITNSNTYILTFERCVLNNCKTALFGDLGGNYGATAVTNSGEMIRLSNSVISNSGTGFAVSGNNMGLFLEKTCIDFTNIFGKAYDSHVFLTDCHLETTYNATPSTMGSDGSPARYLFDLDANPRMNFTNCLFIMGAAGIYSVINPAKAPWNNGVGVVQFDTCNGATTNHASVPAGTINGGFTTVMVNFGTGETTKSAASLFVSRWNAIRAHTVSVDSSVQSGINATITTVNQTQGYVTITLSSAAPSGGIWTAVEF